MSYNIYTPIQRKTLNQLLRFNLISLEYQANPVFGNVFTCGLASCELIPDTGFYISLKRTPKMSRLSEGERKLRDDMFVQGQLYCQYCKKFLPIKKFWKQGRSRSNYGYRYYCKCCDANHKKNKAQQKKYYRKKNRSLRRQAVEAAGGCCQRCGYSEFISGFDFHHVYPASKKKDPMEVVYSKGVDGAWEELDKCCLLCRNCHMARKASDWNSEFIKRDGLGWTVGKDLPMDDNRYETQKTPEYRQATLPDTYRKIKPEQLSLLL